MISDAVIGAIIERKCPGGCKLAECHDAQEDYEAAEGNMEDVMQDIHDENLLDKHFSSIGAVRQYRLDKVKALRRETKLLGILKRIVNNLNLKRLNIPMY